MNLIADKLYSDVKSWPTDSQIIIDRIADRIEAPIPYTCREMLMYVTGANMVHDRLGEAIALGKLPATAKVANLPVWQQIDQERYELVKPRVIAEGSQPDGKSYSRFRKLVNWCGARMLAEHDDLLLTGTHDANGRIYDGLFVDNFDTAPFRSFPGVNVGEHYYALAEYMRLVHRRCWVNIPIPNSMYYAADRPIVDTAADRPIVDTAAASRWAQSLGVRGIYYETPKYAEQSRTLNERVNITSSLIEAVSRGMGVALGFFDAANSLHQQLWDSVSAAGFEYDVYRSRP